MSTALMRQRRLIPLAYEDRDAVLDMLGGGLSGDLAVEISLRLLNADIVKVVVEGSSEGIACEDIVLYHLLFVIGERRKFVAARGMDSIGLVFENSVEITCE